MPRFDLSSSMEFFHDQEQFIQTNITLQNFRIQELYSNFIFIYRISPLLAFKTKSYSNEIENIKEKIY